MALNAHRAYIRVEEEEGVTEVVRDSFVPPDFPSLFCKRIQYVQVARYGTVCTFPAVLPTTQ